MDPKLFENEGQMSDFSNALAKRGLNEAEKADRRYIKEIEDAEATVEKIQAEYKDLEPDEKPLVAEEDLNFAKGQIYRRREFISANDERITGGIEQHPEAPGVDLEDALTAGDSSIKPIFDEISLITGEKAKAPGLPVIEMDLVTTPEPVVLASPGRSKVIQLKGEASDELKKNVAEPAALIPPIPLFKPIPEKEVLPFSASDAVEEGFSFEDVPVDEILPTRADVHQFPQEIAALADEIAGIEESAVAIVEELEASKSDNSFPFPITEGTSLNDIVNVTGLSLEVLLDTNQAIIDERLIDRNYVDYASLPKDKDILVGLTLSIPTVVKENTIPNYTSGNAAYRRAA